MIGYSFSRCYLHPPCATRSGDRWGIDDDNYQSILRFYSAAYPRIMIGRVWDDLRWRWFMLRMDCGSKSSDGIHGFVWMIECRWQYESKGDRINIIWENIWKLIKEMGV